MEKEQKLYIVFVAIFLTFLMAFTAIMGAQHVRGLRRPHRRRREDTILIEN